MRILARTIGLGHDNGRSALSWCTMAGGDVRLRSSLSGHLLWFWLLRASLWRVAHGWPDSGAADASLRSVGSRGSLYAAGYLAVTHGEPPAAWASLAEPSRWRAIARPEWRRDVTATLGYAAYHAATQCARGPTWRSLAGAADW